MISRSILTEGFWPRVTGELTFGEPVANAITGTDTITGVPGTIIQDYNRFAKFIRCTTSGSILLVGSDGRNHWVPDVPAGELFPFWFTMALASGNDFQGNARTSTDFATAGWMFFI